MENKKRLIDANALIAETGKEIYMTDSTKAAFRNIVHKCPTVDAVEVVRCKNCKFWFDNDCQNEAALLLPNEDDFCSYGERREGE